jgi:hypothetical protein
VTQEKNIFCIDSMLKYCAASTKRRLSALPNVSSYTIYTTLKFLALQGALHICDISRLRVNTEQGESLKSRMAQRRSALFEQRSLLIGRKNISV